MRLERKKEQPEIPTASMADIAFLLIVFFMLTTVISATKGIEHMLPQQDQQNEVTEKEDSVYIKVNADNSFSVDNKSPMPISAVYQLSEYLRPIVGNNYKKPIIIHVNPEAKYESMVAVLDEVKKLEAELKSERGIPNLTITIPTLQEAEAWGY